LAALLLVADPAHAEDFPFQKSTESEFEKGFGETKGMSTADKDTADADRLKFGGTLWNEAQYYHFGGASSSNSFFLNPNSLWLYADGRLKNDVRGYAKLKTIYDPTATGSTNIFTGTTTQKTTLDLEELKLMFSAEKKVFFTVGKQKIKWGSGKFWNPTDFLNSDQRNFLYTTDLRSGITQIKTHVPIGASNFYLINGFDDANAIYKVKNSLRAEVPIGPAEISASASTRSGTEPIFGLDFSSALWEFDVYGEVAYSAGNNRTFYSASGSTTAPTRQQIDWTAGIQLEIPYADNDTMAFSFEYFRNGLGYTSTADYPYVIVAGGYEAFRLSQQYGLLMFYLPKPGNWNNVTFSVFNIFNLTDFSATSRINVLFQLLDELQFEVAFGGHYGNGNGEFMYGGQLFDTSARLMISF
jgi:hypothetical protein